MWAFFCCRGLKVLGVLHTDFYTKVVFSKKIAFKIGVLAKKKLKNFIPLVYL